MMHGISCRLTLLLSLGVLVGARDLQAQACQGTPGGGFWAERGDLSTGNTIGGGGALVGRRFGLTAAFRYHDVSSALSGNEVALRAALVLPAGNAQICPVLGVGAMQQDWDVQNGLSLQTTRAAAKAGVGIGVPIRLVGDFSVVPNAIGQYEYSATYFNIDGGGDNDESGAHGGRLDFEFGLLARYKVIYGGFRSNWSPEAKNAYLTRWLAGIVL